MELDEFLSPTAATTFILLLCSTAIKSTRLFVSAAATRWRSASWWSRSDRTEPTRMWPPRYIQLLPVTAQFLTVKALFKTVAAVFLTMPALSKTVTALFLTVTGFSQTVTALFQTAKALFLIVTVFVTYCDSSVYDSRQWQFYFW